MISIIIPYYFKYELFKLTLEYNYPYFAVKNREVILVLDEDSQEKEIIELAKKYNKIKWKILINRNKHLWRNPAPVINSGILQAKQGLIFVMSPESLMKNDVIRDLASIVIKFNDFACGFVNFCKLKDDNTWTENTNWLPYGSICFHSSMAYLVGGYDTRFRTHGAEDDSIRNKFKNLLGCRGFYLESAKIYHLEKDRPLKQTSQENITLLQNCKKEELFGDIKEIIYDTTNETF